MTEKIIRLQPTTTPPTPVDEEVVALLESLLDGARTGRFNGIAVVTIESPALGAYTGVGTAYAGIGVKGGVHTALGGVDVLHERLLRSGIDWD